MPLLTSAVSTGHRHDTPLFSVVTTPISIADAIALADAPSIVARISPADLVHVVDATPTIRAFLTIADQAALAESIAIKNFLAVGDVAHLADAASVKGIVAIADVVAVVDGVAFLQYLFLTVKDRVRTDDGAQALPKGGRPWYPVDGGGF